MTRREAIHGGSTMTSMSSKVTSAVEFAFANFCVISCIWKNTYHYHIGSHAPHIRVKTSLKNTKGVGVSLFSEISLRATKTKCLWSFTLNKSNQSLLVLFYFYICYVALVLVCGLAGSSDFSLTNPRKTRRQTFAPRIVMSMYQ